MISSRLAQAWERQRSFLKGFSHERRTPINQDSYSPSKLRRETDQLDANQREQIDLLDAEAQRMGQIVSDLLDLSRWYAGKLRLDCGSIDPWTSQELIQERFADDAAGRILIVVGPGEGERDLAEGNGQRLDQSLANLIISSIKYAPAPTPTEMLLSGTSQELILHVVEQGPAFPTPTSSEISICSCACCLVQTWWLCSRTGRPTSVGPYLPGPGDRPRGAGGPAPGSATLRSRKAWA